MKPLPLLTFIFLTIFCVLMSIHMALDWNFHGMAGVFAVIATVCLCNLAAEMK